MVVVLDQTVFYPQGGGQPYDVGTITSDGKTFNVAEVRLVDGVVRHVGTFVGDHFVVTEKVVCHVDVERRKINTRLHSAGHLLDMARARLKLPWIPGKGYHFPNGPYVEYACGKTPSVEEDDPPSDGEDGSTFGVKEHDFSKLKIDLETASNAIIAEALPTKVRFVSKAEMAELCESVPEYIPADKPGRVVLYGSFGIPCGGTHVANLSDIGRVFVRKIKQQGEGVVKVAYAIEPS